MMMMNEKLSRSLARFCSLCRSDSAQSMEGVSLDAVGLLDGLLEQAMEGLNLLGGE